MKTTNQIAEIQLICKNNKYNKVLNSKRNKNIQNQSKDPDNDSSLDEGTDKLCHQILITSARHDTRLPPTISNIENIPSKRDVSEKVVVREKKNSKVIDKHIQVNDQSIKQVDSIITLHHNYSELTIVRGNSNDKVINVTRTKKINQPN